MTSVAITTLRTTLFALSMLCFGSTFSLAKDVDIELVLEEARTDEAHAIIKKIKSDPFLDIIVNRTNEQIDIPEKITIRFINDENEETGPHYNPDDREIVMPYHFWDYVESGFAEFYKADITDENLFFFTVDVHIHTLYHELAHALIDVKQIPITGREENAADELATLLILRHFEQGEEIALSASDFFSIEGQQTKEISDDQLFGEHALDDQRFFNILCLVYGHEEGPADDWVKELGVDDDRLALCIEDYEKRARAWDILLAL